MITKYYILTPSQKVEIFTLTILFILFFLLLKPLFFGEPFHGEYVGTITLIFFVWYGLTLLMKNSLMISNEKLNQTYL
jgi:hypothetical protein